MLIAIKKKFNKCKLEFSVISRIAKSLLRHIQCLKIFRILIRIFTPNYNIIEASALDTNLLNEFVNKETSEQITISDQQATYFIAKTKDKIIGSIQLVRHDKSYFPYDGYWLCSLIIQPFYRGMGIGEALSLQVINKACEEGVLDLFLLVNEKNRAAISLYSKLNFKKAVLPSLEENLKHKQAISPSYVVLRRKLK